MTTAEFIAHLRELASNSTRVQVIVAIECGGLNLSGTVLQASVATIKFGGPGVELTLDPTRIISVTAQNPFESESPTAGRGGDAVTRAFELELCNGDRAAVYELVNQD